MLAVRGSLEWNLCHLELIVAQLSLLMIDFALCGLYGSDGGGSCGAGFCGDLSGWWVFDWGLVLCG